MSSPALTIIGERINSSRKTIARAIEYKDAAFIQQEARMQQEAGASYIDVNAGAFVRRETMFLPWLVKTVQEAVDLPLCLDTPNTDALKLALQEHRGKPIINSVTLEAERMNAIVPLVLEYSCKVVALTVDSSLIPADATRKFDIGARLIDTLAKAGVTIENIYVDPAVMPVSVAGNMGAETLGAISKIRQHFPAVHIVCGISNVSFQLPQRPLLNATFLAMAMGLGLDTAIVDPCESAIAASILAAEALLGRDEFCMRYISAYREGRLGAKPKG